MKKLLLGLFTLAALSWAGDLSGTWKGEAELKRGGETRPDTAHLVLTQTGEQVTGTVGPNPEKQLPISKGTVNGSDVVLEASIPERDGRLVLRLKLDGDKLTGTIKSEGGEGEGMSGTLTLSRVK